MKVLSSFHRIAASRQLIAIFAVLLGLNACYNEPNTLGGNLIPSEDNLSVKIDTSFEISGYTLTPSKVTTNGFTYGTLGCLNSKIFGKTKADFLTQVNLGYFREKNPLYGSFPVPDSLILTFKLSHYKGIKNKPITVTLFESKKRIIGTEKHNGLDPVDSWYDAGTPISTVVYQGESVLRFVLDTTLARRFLNADRDSIRIIQTINSKPDTSYHKYTEHDSLLTQYYHGFYLTCNDIVGDDGVMYFLNYSDSLTRMKLCYHSDTAKIKTIYTYDYIISSSYSSRFSHFVHDYATADPAYKMNFRDDTLTQDSVFYIQNLGGVQGLIKLDGIDAWAKKMPITISKAELRLELYDYPLGLPKDSIINNLYYYVELTDDKGLVYTEDQKLAQMEQQSTVAKYNRAKKYYSINLTTHLQSILRKKVTQKNFYIVPQIAPSDNGDEAVFKSRNNSSPMKLIITYSKL